jgi:hypothetical protein
MPLYHVMMQQWKEWNSPTSLAFFRPKGSELCRRLDPDKRLYFLFSPFFLNFFLIFILLKILLLASMRQVCRRRGGGLGNFLRPTVRLLGLCLFWNFRIVMNLKRVGQIRDLWRWWQTEHAPEGVHYRAKYFFDVESKKKAESGHPKMMVGVS